MSRRTDKVEERLRVLASEFLNKETAPTPLVTVTRASVSPDLKRATIYITVLPESEEEESLAYVNRKAGVFRSYAKPRLTFRNLPYFTFEIDRGERNRQRIDELTSNI